FDRYPDGSSFLPTHRPALPQPIAALTIAGIFYAMFRAGRDSRFALLTVWFITGLIGVASTVETPDFLRSSGALVTFPFFSAVVVVDVTGKVAELISRQRQRSRPGLPLTSPDGRAKHRLQLPLQDVWLGALALSAVCGCTFLYFGVYRAAMAPSWDGT